MRDFLSSFPNLACWLSVDMLSAQGIHLLYSDVRAHMIDLRILQTIVWRDV